MSDGWIERWISLMLQTMCGTKSNFFQKLVEISADSARPTGLTF